MEDEHPQEQMETIQVMGEVADLARRQVGLADVAVVLVDKGDTSAVPRPVRPLAVVKQLVVKWWWVVEHVQVSGRLLDHTSHPRSRSVICVDPFYAAPAD